MKIQRFLSFFFAAAGCMLAQMSGMGGGMGPGPSGPSGPSVPFGSYMQMFQSIGNTPMMGSGMGVGMTDDLAVAADGTAFVVRAVAQQPGNSTQQYSWQYELAAISPMDGSAVWKLQLPGGRVSRPVQASDGLLYLTVDNYQMFYANYTGGGSMMNQPQAQANDGQLLAIQATAGGASIVRTMQTTSDVLSAPRIVSDPAGGYLIYVLGYDMMSWTNGASSFAPGEKMLYAYRPDGSLKFSVKLSQ